MEEENGVVRYCALKNVREAKKEYVISRTKYLRTR